MLQAIKVTTTGSAGAATGTQTGTFQARGYLMGVRLNYHASAPATTVVAITEANGMQRTLLTAPASATDVTFNPQNIVNEADGAASDFFWPFYLDGVTITVPVTLSDALTDAVEVLLSIAGDVR